MPRRKLARARAVVRACRPTIAKNSEPNGCIRWSRTGTADPLLPAKVSRSSDRSTLKAGLAWRPAAATKSRKLPLDEARRRSVQAHRGHRGSALGRAGSRPPDSASSDAPRTPSCSRPLRPVRSVRGRRGPWCPGSAWSCRASPGSRSRPCRPCLVHPRRPLCSRQ